MVKLIKSELYYQHFSKYVYILLTVILLLSFFSSFSQYNLLKSTEQNYLMIRESFIDEGLDINEYLNKDYHIETEGDQVIVENDLKYYYLKYHTDLAAMSIKNSVNQVLSSSIFVFFPIVLSIYTIMIVYMDFKYSVFKIKAMRATMFKIFMSKLLSILIVVFMSIIFLCITFAIFQFGFKSIIELNPSIKIDYNVIEKISLLGKAPLQIFVIFMISSINVIFFFFLTLLTKSNIGPLFVLIAYNLFIPVLGKFDLKQNFLLLYDEIFYKNSSTFSKAMINQPFSLFNLFISILIVSILILLMNYITRKKGYIL